MDAKVKVVWPDNRVNIADPHELDARIVGFRIRPGHPWYGLGLSDPLFALGDAVDAAKAAEQALTDHESALAELSDWKLEVVSRLGMDDWNANSTTPTDVYRHVQWLEKRAVSTLLSGLEALAGEWIAKADDYEAKSEASDCRVTKEWFEGMAEGHIDCANALTRTLASAGLEGK